MKSKPHGGEDEVPSIWAEYKEGEEARRLARMARVARGEEKENFFDITGWLPQGYNEDGTPWYMIPMEVMEIELRKLGLLVGKDRERRTKPLNWGEIMAERGHRQDVCLLKKPFMTITAEMLR